MKMNWLKGASRWVKQQWSKVTGKEQEAVAIRRFHTDEPKPATVPAKKPTFGGPSRTTPHWQRKWHRKHQRMARRITRMAA
jgi:hypothetical protein